MKPILRVALAVYLAGFLLFIGLVGVIVLNILDLTDVKLGAELFVLSALLVVGSRLVMARVGKNAGMEANG